jgi:hypothetical protein
MREINKIADALFEKIRDRFEDVSLGDENAKATNAPESARFFNFDYAVDGENYGNITMSLIDEKSLKVYYSKNITEKLSDQDRQKWYAFLRELREFARRNLLSFEPRDITRGTLKYRDIHQQSRADGTFGTDEVVSESRMYGTVNRSYESFGPVRIKLKHNKPIVDEAPGARSRNIDAIFLENDQGERFRLPFNNLSGARAMARHVSAGGVPNDELGCHITNIVKEMTALRPFVFGMRNRTFEDVTTNDMVESAFEYHGLLKNTLKKLRGRRGYTEFKDNFKPALNETDVDVESLKEKFVKRIFDDRLAEALPIVHRAYEMKQANTNPYLQAFEGWATKISEGVWAVPDSDEAQDKLQELLAEPLEVGVDAANATAALSDIIGDDELYDDLAELAEQDPASDARPLIQHWLRDNGYSNLAGEDQVEPEKNMHGSAMGGVDGTVNESHDSYEAVQAAIIRRIIHQHKDALAKYGPEAIMQAAEDEAAFVGDVEEIGSSDVSGWVRSVIQALESGQYHDTHSDVLESDATYDEDEEDYGEEDQEDQSFYVVLADEDGEVFVGSISKEDGRWRERRVSGKAPYGWSGSNYMSYLKPNDIMRWIRNDYERNYVIKGPFFDEESLHAATSWLQESQSKPRNFVAKNAPRSGAGAHKNKKKAERQGDVKHKKNAEAEQQMAEASTMGHTVGFMAVPDLKPGDKAHHGMLGPVTVVRHDGPRVVVRDQSRQLYRMSPHKLQPAEDTTEDRKPSLKNPQDNPCWSGYHPVGTKKKNGQTVPNCVPKESINEETTADVISAALTAKGVTYSRDREEEIINMISDEMKLQGMSGKNIRHLMSYDQDFIPDVLAGLARGVTEGFKNTYSVGDRVESPQGTGIITVVSKNVNVDGRVKVKLDDPDRAGEDGKHKDTFVFTTHQLKHVAEQGVAEDEHGSRKPFGVRYKVFAGREGRVSTKEYWTTSEEKLQKAVAKIQALDNFYGIDGYSYPKEQPGVAEGSEGSWVVYDGAKIKRFKTHEGAKAYAEKNGGKVASSEYYHDKIQQKQGVAEAGPFSYGAKKPRRGSLRDQMARQSKKYYDQQPVIEPKDQMVGVAKVVKKGVAEGSEIKIPTADGITMQDIRLMAGEGKLSQKTIQQAIAVIRKQRQPRQSVTEDHDQSIFNRYVLPALEKILGQDSAFDRLNQRAEDAIGKYVIPALERAMGEESTFDELNQKAEDLIGKYVIPFLRKIMGEESERVAEARRPTDFATITIENPDDTGDIDLEVGYHTEGDYYPATRLEPASYPEIIIDSVRRTDTGAEILSTLDDGTYEYILNQLYDRQEQYEGVNEISDKTKASYQKQAQKQVQDLTPHARTGEYRDMAKNIINKREQGLSRLGTVAENMLADYARNLDSISEGRDGRHNLRESTGIDAKAQQLYLHIDQAAAAIDQGMFGPAVELLDIIDGQQQALLANEFRNASQHIHELLQEIIQNVDLLADGHEHGLEPGLIDNLEQIAVEIEDLVGRLPEESEEEGGISVGDLNEQGVAEATGDTKFDTMMGNIVQKSQAREIPEEELRPTEYKGMRVQSAIYPPSTDFLSPDYEPFGEIIIHKGTVNGVPWKVTHTPGELRFHTNLKRDQIMAVLDHLKANRFPPPETFMTPRGKMKMSLKDGPHKTGVTEGLESLESLIGQRVYVKSVGEMGTVSDVSMAHRNSLIVDLDNGDLEIAHFTDLSQEQPGMMRRMMDKIKSPVAATAPLKESTDTNNSDADVAELRRLAGLK